MKKFAIGIYIAIAIAAIIGFEILKSSAFYVIDPGETGVRITLGTIDPQPVGPGFGFKMPMMTEIKRVNTRQTTREIAADCFSSDLQQVKLTLKVLYRIPESFAIPTVRDFNGDPFEALIVPRIQEAIKEVTAEKTAANIVKTREEIKVAGLAKAREKIGKSLEVSDIVIENVSLSKDLESAIEAKMVQQQEAEKALFRQQQAETDAKTVLIKAKADAESIRIQGDALQKNPKLVELKMVEKWDGKAPQVLGAGSQVLMSLPGAAGP